MIIEKNNVAESSKGYSLMNSHDKECKKNICWGKVVPLLYKIGTTITEGGDLHETLAILLNIMKDMMLVERGMFTLFHQKTGKIFVHESIGLTKEEEARGIYDIGEGVTGKAVEDGKPIVVMRIRDEPAFLNRTLDRDDASLDNSFLCIPIMRGKKVLGTISIEKRYNNEAFIKQDLEFLKFIASLIAQTVELYLLENEEKVFWEAENRRLQDALKAKFQPSNIIGNSSPMRQVYGMIEKIAKARTTVLILGESGVGKELVANAIHYNSACADGPFIKFNCAALPENIIESELFGHEKGSFTGAINERKGRFEEADGGTILIDEIGELSLTMQTKFLRVLQERTFERVGGNKSIQVNIRILAATNKNLMAMVEKGAFREDLYYRLNVFPITIPPLRERGSDIIALADYFVMKFAKENGKAVKRISTPALQMFMNYSWPGNVRELENVIERAVILCEDEVIHGYNLPPSLQESTISGTADRSNLESKIEAVEYEYLVEALKNSRGNMTDAAKNLGMTRRMLGLRLEKYKIEYKNFRSPQSDIT
ncbi:MAG TPA: sigma-54-dependent Fis family transcriptional regulator [Fibrobacteres bacterium]|nr:sigma-54-dependent Fis family transcriptional regulator [Fibrobacterota bacterium]